MTLVPSLQSGRRAKTHAFPGTRPRSSAPEPVRVTSRAAAEVCSRENGSASPRNTVHRQSGTTVDTRGQHATPGGGLSLLGESRVATNIRGFFSTRISSALPDTGECHYLLLFNCPNIKLVKVIIAQTSYVKIDCDIQDGRRI